MIPGFPEVKNQVSIKKKFGRPCALFFDSARGKRTGKERQGTTEKTKERLGLGKSAGISVRRESEIPADNGTYCLMTFTV